MDIQAFENMMKSISLSSEEKLIVIQRRKGLCICMKCPSYRECGVEEDELAFCSTGKNKECVAGELGCICGECPVAKELELKHTYYCLKGSENQQAVLSALEVRHDVV
jgi:hypothetical protein